MNDPTELQLPSCNRVFIAPRAEESRDTVAPASFDDVPLYFCDGPAIETTVSRRLRYVLQVEPTSLVGLSRRAQVG